MSHLFAFDESAALFVPNEFHLMICTPIVDGFNLSLFGSYWFTRMIRTVAAHGRNSAVLRPDNVVEMKITELAARNE